MARRFAVVEMLANEDIPVMGHLAGATQHPGAAARAVGRTADEALALMQDFAIWKCRRLRSRQRSSRGDGHQPRTGLVTVSLGSGPGGDVMDLFQNDICGENPLPRHSRASAIWPH